MVSKLFWTELKISIYNNNILRFELFYPQIGIIRENLDIGDEVLNTIKNINLMLNNLQNFNIGDLKIIITNLIPYVIRNNLLILFNQNKLYLAINIEPNATINNLNLNNIPWEMAYADSHFIETLGTKYCTVRKISYINNLINRSTINFKSMINGTLSKNNNPSEEFEKLLINFKVSSTLGNFTTNFFNNLNTARNNLSNFLHNSIIFYLNTHGKLNIENKSVNYTGINPDEDILFSHDEVNNKTLIEPIINSPDIVFWDSCYSAFFNDNFDPNNNFNVLYLFLYHKNTKLFVGNIFKSNASGGNGTKSIKKFMSDLFSGKDIKTCVKEMYIDVNNTNDLEKYNTVIYISSNNYVFPNSKLHQILNINIGFIGAMKIYFNNKIILYLIRFLFCTIVLTFIFIKFFYKKFFLFGYDKIEIFVLSILISLIVSIIIPISEHFYNILRFNKK